MSATEATTPQIAIVGAGFIAEYHVEGLRAAGGNRIGPLVARSEARARKRAAELGVADISTDLGDVLQNPAVQGVVIATPDNTHRDLAIRTLEAGKAVLLQKPMALDKGECVDILRAADTSGTSLTVSFMHRYFPEVVWLRGLLASGQLGDIHTIRIRNATPGADWADWFFSPENVSGGVVMQLGVHGIDLIQHLFGPIGTVSARAATLKPERVLSDGRIVTTSLDDNVLAHYELASGALVTHEMSYTEVAGCDRFRLELNCAQGTVWLRTERGIAALNAPNVTGVEGWMTPDIPSEPLGRAHHAAWLDIAAGRAGPDDTGHAGLSSILVAEAIYRAADSGRREPVPAVADVLEGGA